MMTTGASDSNLHAFAVCAYKESPFLKECIESLLSQKLPSKVVMCTSTPNDHIQALAQDYSIPLFINEGSSGIGPDWEFALNCSDTKFVTLAHQDDIYCPSYSATAVEHMRYAEEMGATPLIFFSDYGEIRNGEVVDSNRILETKRRLLRPLASAQFVDSVKKRRSVLRLGNPICCPSVTYNNEILPKPLFDTSMKQGLDWKAWERLSRMDGAFCYAPEVLMRHRIHEESETSQGIETSIRAKEDRRMLELFWPKPLALLISKIYSIAEKSNQV